MILKEFKFSFDEECLNTQAEVEHNSN